MVQIGNKILMLCNEFQTLLNVFIVLGALGIGAAFMWNEESREKKKKALPFIIGGAILIAAAANLGAEYGAKLKF